MVKITINEELCKGCGLCARACPKDLIELCKTKLNAKGYHPAVVTDVEKCIACGKCSNFCPKNALVLHG